MHTILVALLAALMTFSPATAGRFCGGHRGGSYYGGCQPVYYESYDCGSCCGGEVVVSEGCGDCGACGECASCGETGMAPTPAEPLQVAPEPPAPTSRRPVQPRTPATVNRVPMQPAPALPPHAMPGTTDMRAMPPAKPKADAPVTPVTPPVTIAPPPVEKPAVKPITPPAETHDDLFGSPAVDQKPLPAEEPATPSETDDFFFSAPAEEPADEPSSQPSDDDLFGPPAEEEKKPAEEEKPADDLTDDLFGGAEAILELPGGLASREFRRWVDDTGHFSCQGRLLRMVDGQVQLRKDNGRTTTVPLARLCQADLEFVNRQASARQVDTIGKTAQVSAGRSQ